MLAWTQRWHQHDTFYVPAGGHGIAWDGPFNKELRRLVEETYATGKIIAAVDHGPAALVHARNIKLGDPREGQPLLFHKDVRTHLVPPACTCQAPECPAVQT